MDYIEVFFGNNILLTNFIKNIELTIFFFKLFLPKWKIYSLRYARLGSIIDLILIVNDTIIYDIYFIIKQKCVHVFYCSKIHFLFLMFYLLK
jgi:hypothetical protein